MPYPRFSPTEFWRRLRDAKTLIRFRTRPSRPLCRVRHRWPRPGRTHLRPYPGGDRPQSAFGAVGSAVDGTSGLTPPANRPEAAALWHLRLWRPFLGSRPPGDREGRAQRPRGQRGSLRRESQSAAFAYFARFAGLCRPFQAASRPPHEKCCGPGGMDSNRRPRGYEPSR